MVSPTKLARIKEWRVAGDLRASKTGQPNPSFGPGKLVVHKAKSGDSDEVLRTVLDLPEGRRIFCNNFHDAFSTWGFVIAPGMHPEKAIEDLLKSDYYKGFVNAKDARGDERLKCLPGRLSRKPSESEKMIPVLVNLSQTCPPNFKGFLSKLTLELTEAVKFVSASAVPAKKSAQIKRDSLVGRIITFLSDKDWALLSPENPVEIHLFDPRLDTSIPLVPPPPQAGRSVFVEWYKSQWKLRMDSPPGRTNDSSPPRAKLREIPPSPQSISGARVVDWGEGSVVVAQTPLKVGDQWDNDLVTSLKKRSVSKGWLRLVLVQGELPLDESLWLRLIEIISQGNTPGLDPRVAEEVTRMVVTGTDLFGISDPLVVLSRSGKPLLVDNFDFETPHSIGGSRKAGSGLTEYLQVFEKISVPLKLKDYSLEHGIVKPDRIITDPDDNNRFILTCNDKYKVSCSGIDQDEIVKFLGLPDVDKIVQWKAAPANKRPKGFGSAKVCFSEWSRGYRGWDSNLMITNVLEMTKSERTMIAINHPFHPSNPPSQKKKVHGIPKTKT
jgi:hypothetical protein